MQNRSLDFSKLRLFQFFKVFGREIFGNLENLSLGLSHAFFEGLRLCL